MLNLILVTLVVKDVDESTAVAVEDMEVLTTLDEAAEAEDAPVEAALIAALIFLFLCIIDLHNRKAGWRSFIR